MLDVLSARERKAKGLRELKNLDCSVSPVKSQRRQGRSGSKYATTYLLRGALRFFDIYNITYQKKKRWGKRDL
jgi:hypothetical protein